MSIVAPLTAVNGPFCFNPRSVVSQSFWISVAQLNQVRLGGSLHIQRRFPQAEIDSHFFLAMHANPIVFR